MNRHSALNLTLSVVCFTIIWGIYQQLLVLLAVEGHPESSKAIQFVAAIGLFGFLFQFAVWVSQFAAHHWFSDESKFVGTWFQIFRIDNYTKSDIPLDSVRHGQVTIGFAGDFLEITAENKKIDGTGSSSSWHSDKVSIQGSRVWLLFSSTGAGRGSTHGNMLFQYQIGKGLAPRPDKLTGNFADSSPATHFGSIELFRDHAEYLNRLKEISAEYGAGVT